MPSQKIHLNLLGIFRVGAKRELHITNSKQKGKIKRLSKRKLNFFQSSALRFRDPNGRKHNCENTHNHVNGEGSC